MLRIAVSVEGDTEREFVKKMLSPLFYQHDIRATRLGKSGGHVTLETIKLDCIDLLYSFDLVTTFYDFYGFKNRDTNKVVELEEKILLQIPKDLRHKFIPYIQQYEFEALIFSNPEIVANQFQQENKLVELERAIKQSGGPEHINDSYETCPSRRLEKLFSAYDKKLHGPIICEKIGLDKMRQQCPRFDNWLTNLENKIENFNR